MTPYETAALGGRKPIASAHKTHPTSGIRVTNAKAWARIRKHELTFRIDKLDRLIKEHAGDPDFRASINGWRRELMDSRLEKSGLGV
jgi:hypothetical protein